MKRIYGLIAVMVLVSMFVGVVYAAAPPKGYLSATEIKALLDRFSDPMRLEDVRATLGNPTEENSRNPMWYFDDYNVNLLFNRIGNTLTLQGLGQFFDSYDERSRRKVLLTEQFNALMRTPRTQTDSMTTWDYNNYNYGMGLSSIRGIPVLVFVRSHKDEK